MRQSVSTKSSNYVSISIPFSLIYAAKTSASKCKQFARWACAPSYLKEKYDCGQGVHFVMSMERHLNQRNAFRFAAFSLCAFSMRSSISGNRETTGPEFRVIHGVIHTIWRHITSYSVYHTQYAIHIMCIYGVPTVYQCVFSIFDQYHVYTHSRPLILHSVFMQIGVYTHSKYTL